MKMSQADLLILPDVNALSPDDWQNRWLDRMETAELVEQKNWKKPNREAWVDTLIDAVETRTRPVILIGHGLGVATIAHAAEKLADTVVGAILVAPRDLEQTSKFASFAPPPSAPLPFPSMLVAAHNDPDCTIERAAEMANQWGAEFHEAGNSGHINAASGQGIWPEGMMILSRLLNRL